MLKMFFFFFLSAGMKWGGGGLCTRAGEQCSWKRGSEPFVLVDEPGEQYPPILSNRDCRARKNCFEDLQCLEF